MKGSKMSLSQTEVSKLYVSIFGRASEGEGNNYWQTYSDDMAYTADMMLKTEAAIDYFGDTLNSNETFIEFIYENTLGKSREDDPDGVAYWIEKLNSGESKGSVVNSIVYSATQPENAGDARDQFLNRVEVSNYVADKIYSFGGDYAQFQNYINAVSNNEYTKLAIEKIIDYDSSLPKIGDFSYIGEKHVDSLDSGYHWSDTTITYSFNTVIPSEYEEHPESYLLTNNWTPFDSRDKEIVREVMDNIEEFTNLNLVEVSYGGDIRFNKVDMDNGANGFTMLPMSESDPISGDVWINNNYSEELYGGNGDQSYGYLTIAHEIGHALGLKHPFDDYPVLSSEENNTNYTLMSYYNKNSVTMYFDENRCEQNMDAMPNQYQLYDVDALIAIYGANSSTNSGNDTYELSTLYNDKRHYTIWDTGGVDTIDLSETTHNSKIDLRDNTVSTVDYHSAEEQERETEEYFHEQGIYDLDDWIYEQYFYSQCDPKEIYTGEDNLAIAEGVIIENLLLGAGDDTVYDNLSSNRISTGAGNDTIFLSAGGYDTVDGGDGNDTVYINRYSSDIKLEEDLNGNISVFDMTNQVAIAYLVGIEQLSLTDNTLMLG
jgi:hypothetical protein